MVRVETVLESWRTARQDTAQAVEDFPAGELDFRPTPDLMTFREIARHILESGHALAGLLLAGEENLARPDFREKLKTHMLQLPEPLEPAVLASALRQSVEKRTTELARQSPDFFAKVITRFDGQQVTRLEMLQFIKEHELTHRAQLFLYLRLKGIVPVTTRRRQARPAGR